MADTHETLQTVSPEELGPIYDITPLGETGLIRRKLVVGIGGAAATVLAVAGSFMATRGGDHEGGPVSSGTVAESNLDYTHAQLMSVLKDPVIHTVSDKVLSDGGYNCGHTIESADPATFAYDNQIDFLNSKPELTKDLLDFNVKDKNFGMGEAAFHILTSGAIFNSNTSPDKQIDRANDNNKGDMNAYAHKIQTLAVNPPRNYLNFTCENPDGSVNVRPVNKIKVTGHVNGFKVDKETLGKFEAAIKADGRKNTLDVISLGKHKVNGKEEELFFVVTEAEGCDNPIRLILNHPNKPVTPGTTTTEKVTTTTGTTPSTFAAKKIYPTHGPHTQHSAGGSPEQGMDPQKDGADGFGPGDTHHELPSTVPKATVPTPGTTGNRPPVTAKPVSAPTVVVTTAPDGTPPPTNKIP